MSVTVVDLHEALNNASAGPHPGSGPHETLWAEDWNTLRTAVALGTSGIHTKGAKIGSDGIQTVGDLPFVVADGSFIRFRDGGNSEVVVGYLSSGGELGMQRIRTTEKAFYGAGLVVVQEGDVTETIPETSPSEWHRYLKRGAGNVVDFDVQHDGTLEALHKLFGDYVANTIGKGMIFRHGAGDGLIRLRAKSDGSGLVIEDVDDFSARPVTYTNERDVMSGSGVFVDEVTPHPDGSIDVVTTSANPLQYQIGVAATGISASHLDIGSGATQVNVDALFNGGGGIGVAAALTTPAEKALISTNAAAIAALQAEIALTVKTLRTAGGDVITPASGQIQLANSSSVIFDKPGANTLRAVSSGGGGGGGGGVSSFTAASGLENTGTAADPIVQLDIKVGNGLIIDTGEVTLEWAGSGGDFGVATLPARSDHLHSATYSPLGHTHAGFAAIGDITYEQLDSIGDVGTVAGTLAAGDDSRLHTQGTDVGSTLDGIFVVDSARAGAAPASGQRGFGVNRGAATDAVVVFDDADDTWKAGLAGSVAAIILDGDARLTDTRDPNSHDIDALHTGSLGAGRVAPAYTPSVYTPASADLDGHLAGIDAELGSVVGQDEETFTGFATTIALTEKLIGGPVNPGVTVRRAGTLNVARLRADVDLAGGTSIEVTVSNLTTPAAATITLNATQQSTESLGMGIPFLAGEVLAAQITGITGAHGATMLAIELVRE